MLVEVVGYKVIDVIVGEVNCGRVERRGRKIIISMMEAYCK